MHLVDRMVNNIHRVFYKAGIKIVRYADDFVLMGKRITKEVIEKLKNTLSRMGLKLNETKTRLIQAQDSIFDFLGFTIRYDKDILGRSTRYWNIQASNKSMNKIREKISEHLHKSGHHNPKQVAQGLNAIIRGWLNYYEIPKVSYPTMKNRALRHYLMKN